MKISHVRKYICWKNEASTSFKLDQLDIIGMANAILCLGNCVLKSFLAHATTSNDDATSGCLVCDFIFCVEAN